jgi:hypothetical protein
VQTRAGSCSLDHQASGLARIRQPILGLWQTPRAPSEKKGKVTIPATLLCDHRGLSQAEQCNHLSLVADTD